VGLDGSESRVLAHGARGLENGDGTPAATPSAGNGAPATRRASSA
jgi:hypothetical protein